MHNNYTSEQNNKVCATQCARVPNWVRGAFASLQFALLIRRTTLTDRIASGRSWALRLNACSSSILRTFCRTGAHCFSFSLSLSTLFALITLQADCALRPRQKWNNEKKKKLETKREETKQKNIWRTDPRSIRVWRLHVWMWTSVDYTRWQHGNFINRVLSTLFFLSFFRYQSPEFHVAMKNGTVSMYHLLW